MKILEKITDDTINDLIRTMWNECHIEGYGKMNFYDLISILDASDPMKAIEILQKLDPVKLNSYEDISLNTLLYYTDNMEVCKFLLDNLQEASIEHQNEERETVLIHSIINDKVEKSKLIINKVVSVPNYRKYILINSASWNRTPLHEASIRGMKDVCELLINNLNFSDVTRKDREGDTALHLAIRFNRNEVAKLIINKLESPWLDDIYNNDEETVLHVAIEKGNVEICKLLIDKMSENGLAKYTNIKRTSYELAYKHELYEVRDLINQRKKALYNEKADESKKYILLDIEKKNILHVAVEQNDINGCRFIINKDNSHQFTKNEDGDTPLDISIKKGYKEIEELLREKLNYNIIPFQSKCLKEK